jgi:DNA polymerase III subunit beta
MDLTISKDELTKLLFISQSVVERRSTMPVLSNFLLSTDDGKLRLVASDLEITVSMTAPAKIRSAGSIAVNAKMFSDIVRELPNSDVTLKTSEGARLEISAQQSRLRLIGTSAEEFPSLPGMSLKPRARTSSAVLSEMIARTVYAVSSDETRFNLSGVCFEMVTADGKKNSGGNLLRMVATDGHRLAIITRPVPLAIAGKGEGEKGPSERVIVPRKGLNEVKRALDSGDDREVGFDILEGFLLLEADEIKMAVRLIDGEFPDYEQVIPKQRGAVARVSSNNLIQALKRVSLLVSDKNKGVRLDFQNETLRVSSSSPELGDATEELAYEYDGAVQSIGFNARYLIEAMASVAEDQTVFVELNGISGPAKFSVESDEASFGIVMPMRL